MRICFCLLASAVLLLSFSCSNAEEQKLRQELERQEVRIERLKSDVAKTKSLLEQTRGKLSKALTEAQEAAEARDALLKELDGAHKTALEATEKFEALAAQNLKPREPAKVVEAEPTDDADWFERLPDDTRARLKPYDVAAQETPAKAFKYLASVLWGRETRIRELMIERDFFQRKFQEFMALKNEYENAFAKMKADGINIEKYVKQKK